MTTTTMMLPAGGIALVGAQTGDIGDRPPPVQAMQVEMTQDIVDELLESMRSGKPPQILFGRTPVRVPLFFRSMLCARLPILDGVGGRASRRVSKAGRSDHG
jgi:hypothetical protein